MNIRLAFQNMVREKDLKINLPGPDNSLISGEIYDGSAKYQLYYARFKATLYRHQHFIEN